MKANLQTGDASQPARQKKQVTFKLNHEVMRQPSALFFSPQKFSSSATSTEKPNTQRRTFVWQTEAPVATPRPPLKRQQATYFQRAAPVGKDKNRIESREDYPDENSPLFFERDELDFEKQIEIAERRAELKLPLEHEDWGYYEDEASRKREHQSFGMDPGLLRKDRAELEWDFHYSYRYAQRWMDSKAKDEKNYRIERVPYTGLDGTTQMENRVVRNQDPFLARVRTTTTAAGKSVIKGFDQDVLSPLRKAANRDRMYGSKYGENRDPTDSLLVNKKEAWVIGAAVGNNTAKLGSALASAPVGAGIGLGVIGNLPAMVDISDVSDTWTSVVSTETKLKSNLNFCENAHRNMGLLEKATPKEAKDFLDFNESAQKLRVPTPEEKAIRRTAKIDAVRSGPVQVGSVMLSDSVMIAKAAGEAGLVFSVASGAAGTVASAITAPLDIIQSKEELKRRKAQRDTALERKLIFGKVQQLYKGHPQYALLTGMLVAFDQHQNRLIDRASREQKIALIRGMKGSAGIPLATASLVATVAVSIGVLAATASVTGGATLVPAVVMGGALIYRAVTRHRGEHSAKWRQRAACALALDKPREELEKLLAADPKDAVQLAVHIGEGDYLAEQQCFASTRSIEFEARDNEYIALRLLAQQIQDIIKNGVNPGNEPFVELLRSMDFNSVKLLALCKAASDMPPREQLDYIQSKLAPLFAIKFSGTTQALPHASVFLEHFKDAWLSAWAEVKNEPKISLQSRRFHIALRQKLEQRYAESGIGMAEFMEKANEFLVLTRDKIHPDQDGDLRKELMRFCEAADERELRELHNGSSGDWSKIQAQTQAIKARREARRSLPSVTLDGAHINLLKVPDRSIDPVANQNLANATFSMSQTGMVAGTQNQMEVKQHKKAKALPKPKAPPTPKIPKIDRSVHVPKVTSPSSPKLPAKTIQGFASRNRNANRTPPLKELRMLPTSTEPATDARQSSRKSSTIREAWNADSRE